jgi:SAM-dependent methyltransferase
MADESMVRTLSAQTAAVWPQELPLLRRHALPAAPRVLDAGCGTGEGTLRIAEAFPAARLLGVDVLEGSLARARERCAHLGDRVRFEPRSIFDSGLAAASFDLTVCRHVIHSIPHPEKVVAELARVTAPGGVVHLVAEDYGMIHFPPRRFDPQRIWPDAPIRFGRATGTDLLVGRRAPSLLAAQGLEQVRADYVIVDTLRVPREVFAAIWEAWRDGYVDVVAEQLGMTVEQATAEWNDQIDTLRDPASYAAWIVPVVSGVVPLARGAS